ncbi:MAG: DUF6491 family protein [Lysobacterales bacterium]|jgi:hypothetical protein
MNTRKILTLAVCLTLAGPLAAEEKAMDKSIDLVSGPPEQCISLIRIDHTKIIDDQNIVFYMKGGDIYRNHMPYPCGGLRAQDTYMYRTSVNQLCSNDIITPLDQIGIGFSPRASCGLGMFYPVTKDDVAKLKERVKEQRKQ